MIKLNIISMLLLGAAAMSSTDVEALISRDKITPRITQVLVKVGDTVDINTVYSPVVQCSTPVHATIHHTVVEECTTRRVGWLKF